MKVTVCELPNEPTALAKSWDRLVEHVRAQKSELVLLPEMPFYRWLPHSKSVDPTEWEAAVASHSDWITKLSALAPATVISTRPTRANGKNANIGYIWTPGHGAVDVHAKYYLPDEPGFWEASWYQRGDGDFSTGDTPGGKAGFLICTELWFTQHARAYGKAGARFILCPRATPRSSAEKWVAGGQAAAVISGAYCLSSNLAGTTPGGGDFAGTGWIIEPDEGRVLGLTSAAQPFLTLNLDLSEADRAKHTYPRYVLD